MALIQWSENLYSIYIEKIDQHHKALIELINQLHEAMLNGKSKEIIEGILSDLNEYAIYHFEAEEELMLTHRYPSAEFTNHQKMHNYFKDKLEELIEKYQNDERSVSIETFKYLMDWLINHIQKVDKKISQFI